MKPRLVRPSAMVWLGLLSGLAVLGGLLGRPTVAIAQAPTTTISPAAIEVTLAAGACSDQVVTVALGAVPVPSVDVALLIDVTSSMGGIIETVRAGAGDIVADIRRLTPNAAFALGTFADYPGDGGLFGLLTSYGGASDYPWRVDQDFTTDATELQAALDQVSLMDGGDLPEAYLRALHESQFLAWRTDARKIVILFGDAYPHDPDPGPDNTLDTADDLTQAEVISELADAGITLLAVYADEDNRYFYDAVAGGAGGQAVQLNEAVDIPPIIAASMETAVSRIRQLRLAAEPADDTWTTWDPDSHADVTALEQRDFAVRLCAPAAAVPGDHQLSLSVEGDGAVLGQVPVLIHVPGASLPVVGTFPWLWLGLPLMALAGLAVWLWGRRRATASRAGQARPSSRPSQPSATGRPSRPRPTAGSGADVTHGGPPKR